MIKKLLVGVLIWGWGFGNAVFAQKENYVWIFGEGAGLDFNSGIATPILSGISSFEGCSSISDQSGNLLFYTNGRKVWDRNDYLMPNGDSLGGEENSCQSSIIVPFPGNNSLYYIFTTKDAGIELRYSIVDLSLNNNNGDVTIKNNLLYSGITEKLTAVKHSNYNDTWVMIHASNSNAFIAYLITSAGISSPVISNVGPVFSLLDIEGCMKFSPDGTKLAYATIPGSYVELFDFNNTTGMVTNPINLILPNPNGFDDYGLEFSASGSYLYCSSFFANYVFQWNITSNSEPIINTTIQQLASPNMQWIGAMQLGPDGKIYVANNGGYIGRINSPEMPGTLCNYNDTAIFLSSPSFCGLGLPNFIASYFLPTGINTNNPQQNQLTIFPNPTTDKITISFPETTSENIIVKIYSITGEVVFENENKSTAPITNYQLPVTNLSNGIYFLSVQTDEGLMTKKIVVNH